MGLVTFMGIGFCVSCLVETEGMVVDIINALSVPVALLSEIFFSSSEYSVEIPFRRRSRIPRTTQSARNLNAPPRQRRS